MWSDFFDSVRIISADNEPKCSDCQELYTVNRYTQDATCVANKCVNPTELTVYGWVQPYTPKSQSAHGVVIGDMGLKEKDVIILIYYPMRDEHIAQNSKGIVLQDTPCRDVITYDGRRYKLISNVCIKGFCPPECGGVQCEAVFCLEDCNKSSDAEVVNVVR